jgi:predicted metalloprotease with PDZ domain
MTLITFLEILSSDIAAYESSPGRGHLSLQDADRAAWIEALEYLNASSAGAVLGFLLDLKLRLESKNGSTLDDVMRALYDESRTKGYRGYTEQSLIETFRRVSGLDVRRFFESYVDGKGPIDYDSILKPAGLSLETGMNDQGNRTFAIRMHKDISAERKDFLERLLRGTGIRPNSRSASWLVTSQLERQGF